MWHATILVLCFRANCLTECYTTKAVAYCGCIPWDYSPTKHHTQTGIRICDYYGKSCFNSFLENGLANACKKTCSANCNEVKYTVSVEEKALNWEKMCSSGNEDEGSNLELFERKALEYIRNTT